MPGTIPFPLPISAKTAEVVRGGFIWQLRRSPVIDHWEIWKKEPDGWICAEWAGQGDLRDFVEGSAFLEGMTGVAWAVPSEVAEMLADQEAAPR